MDSPVEVWKSVTDHPKYEISNHARIRVKRTNHIRSLKQRPNKYLQVFLPNEVKLVSHQMHRLVAQHFLVQPSDATEVDHIDKNIANNKASNLRWVSRAEHARFHSRSKGSHLGSAEILFKVRRADETSSRYFWKRDIAASYYRVSIDDLATSDFVFQNIYSRAEVDAVFRPIPLSQYEITADGVLCHQQKDTIVRGKVNSGYTRTHIKIDGRLTSLHRLLLLAWVGPPPSQAYVVNHKNGLTLDNRLDNLEWVTQSQNAQHAYDTGLSTYSPRSIGVNMFELDGTFICRLEKIPPKASQAISFKSNHYEGFLYSFKDTIENWTGAAIREIFPDYNPLVCKNIDFDKIRPYVARNSRPVAQWNVDGSPKMIHDTYKTASNALGVSNAVVCTLAIATEPISSITKCGYLRWATLRDVLEGLAPRPTIVESVIATFQVKIAKGSPNVELDYDFLQEYLEVTGTPRPRPVWQLCLETRARVKRYASGNYAEKALGLGRSTIDQAVRKGVKAGGLFWEWADFARDH